MTLNDAPDLVAVVGDHGIRGFVMKVNLYPRYASPEQATAAQAAADLDPTILTVYDFDGRTVLDTFTLGSSSAVALDEGGAR